MLTRSSSFCHKSSRWDVHVGNDGRGHMKVVGVGVEDGKGGGGERK